MLKLSTIGWHMPIGFWAGLGAATLKAIAASSRCDPKQVMEGLARHHLIKPVVTQGHISDVLPDKVVYDAQMTSGGSGARCSTIKARSSESTSRCYATSADRILPFPVRFGEFPVALKRITKRAFRTFYVGSALHKTEMESLTCLI
jgi:hypothetical protein